MSLFSKKSKDQTPPKPPESASAARSASAPAARANGAAAQQAGAANVNMEEIKAGFERSRRTLIALGEIVAVLMKSPEYRNATLANVQALAAPAISSGQYMVLTAHQKSRGAAAPIALAMWASVSAEVDRRLTQADAQHLNLQPADWTSGNIVWLLVVAGDQRAIPAMLAQLQKTKFKDKVVKLRAKGEDGKMHVRTLGAEVAPAPARQGKPQPVKH